MNGIFAESVYFGMALSIFAYWIALEMKKKFNYAFMNPLLISMVMIIVFLAVCKIDYETFDYGAKYLTYLLTPATVCLAVPLYKQVQILKENIAAVFVGTLCGCMTHALVIIGIGVLMDPDRAIVLSMLPKSVTTPIAMGISNEIQGISVITIVGVCVAGILGAVVGPMLLKLLRITEPAAQGLAIGTASHALGTTKAVELGEVQAAMSSVAIVVTGILTVIMVPLVVKILL